MASADDAGLAPAAEPEPLPPPEPPPRAEPRLDRTPLLFAALLGAGLAVFVLAMLTVHHRPAEQLAGNGGAQRTHAELTHWLEEGFFTNCGLLINSPLGTRTFYRMGTGGYLLTAFVAQKIFGLFAGHYSWRLNAWHNQAVILLLATLLGMLAYRVSRRFGLEPRLAYPLGAAVVAVVFTFPANLFLYWEMSAQSVSLLFATAFLLVEERRADGERTLKRSLVQAAAAFLMAYTEMIFGLAFLCAFGVSRVVLEQRAGVWRRFVLLAVLPCAAAYGMYRLQWSVAMARFPDATVAGSQFMFRTGLDGESLYYGDHLDIAKRRDVARANFPVNRERLFVWKTVFFLGLLAALALLAAYAAGRAPRIAVEALTALAGAWMFYGAVFSQAFLIHPYLYDLLLFAPLVIAVFAVAPSMVEELTRRTGVAVLLVVFCSCWYAWYQLRIYALWYPMPGARMAPAVTAPR